MSCFLFKGQNTTNGKGQLQADKSRSFILERTHEVSILREDLQVFKLSN